MRTLRAALAALAAGAAAAAQTPTPSPTPPPVTALRAARMFDGRSEVAVAGAVVLVQNDRILAAGSGSRSPRAPE